MRTLIHIIPTLENGGAETVLTRLVEEFAKDGVEHFVISLHGNENDFNHAQIAGHCPGYPNVLVEAAVCGTPVIGFAEGDSPSILADHSLGELVSSKNDFCMQLKQQIKTPPSLKERDDALKWP